MSFASDILSWNDQLRGQAWNFFTMGQDLIDFMMPTHKDITVIRFPGEKKTQKIFDSTAPDAIFLMASFLQGSMFPQGSQWFDIKHRMEELNKDKDVSQWLQKCRGIQLASFRQSNFYSVTLELLQDWIVFGNMCVIQERPEKPVIGGPKLVFSSVGFGSYVFFEDSNKRPAGLIRELDMSVQECFEKWGEKCSKSVQGLMKSKPFEPIKIVHAIVPRSLVEYKKIATPKEMPYASLWFEKNEKHRLNESGYPEKPFAIARYNVIAGEVMGRGLGEIALPHVKTINGAVMRGFLEWDKALDPPVMQKMYGVIGDISHRAGSKTIVRSMDAIQPMDKDLRQPNSTHQWNLQDLRRQVAETFFTEQIRHMMGLKEQQGQQRDKTAYQHREELALLHLIMAPTGGRLEAEGLSDIVDTNFSILGRTGQLPQVPDQIREAQASGSDNASTVDITYEGALAKAQRQEELQSMQEYLGEVENAAKIDPKAVDVPNVDMFLRKDAEIRGIQYLLNDETQTAQIRGLKAQIQQLQAALAAAEHASKTAKNLAPMAKVLQMQGQQQQGEAA